MRSCFSFPLFKENFKRLWGISAIGFFIYFMSGSFGLIMSKGDWQSYNVKLCYSTQNPGYLFMDVMLSCIASVAVFAYLNKVNSSGVLHSMPFSRRSLFITNYLSGLFLSAIPAALNTLVVLCIRKDCYISENGMFSRVFSEGATKMFTVQDVLLCLFISLITILFSYSIATLAGIVSGNSVIHMLTGPAFNFLIPIFYISLMLYGEKYIFGFSLSSSIADTVTKMHPAITRAFDAIGPYAKSSSGLSVLLIVMYVLAALALALLAYYAYTKRKLEKAGDSYVFGFVKYLICFFIVFFISTLTSWIFTDGAQTYIAQFIGAVIGFLIGWMIVNKTVRIFNTSGLKAFVIYIAVIVLIVCAFAFDLFGYGKYVPSVNKIESLSFDQSGGVYYDDLSIEIRSPENIERLTALQKEIVAAGPVSDDDYDSYVWVSFNYTLKNGKTVERNFSRVPLSLMLSSDNAAAVYESDEYRHKYDFIKEYDINSCSIYISSTWELNRSDDFISLPKGSCNDEKAELLEAVYKDLSNMSYEDRLSDYASLFNIEIDNGVKDERGYSKTMTVTISTLCANTIEWLRDNAYLEKLIDVDGFTVICADSQSFYSLFREKLFDGGGDKEYMLHSVPESGEGYLIVSDEKLQEELMVNACKKFYSEPDEDLVWCVYFSDRGSGYEEISRYMIPRDRMPEELQAGIEQNNI